MEPLNRRASEILPENIFLSENPDLEELIKQPFPSEELILKAWKIFLKENEQDVPDYLPELPDYKKFYVSFDEPTTVEFGNSLEVFVNLIHSDPEHSSRPIGIFFFNCQISLNHWSNFLRLLSTLPVSALIFESCNLQEQHMEDLLASPLKPLLNKLYFFREICFEKPLASFLKNNPTLQTLYFYESGIGDELVEFIVNKGLAHNQALKELIFDNSELTDCGVMHLARVLTKHPNLSTLSLGNSKISDLGVMALANTLIDRSNDFNLNLNSNPAITDQGATYLTKYVKCLQSLNLSHNRRIVSLESFYQALKNPKLIKLNLIKTSICDKSFKELIQEQKKSSINRSDLTLTVAANQINEMALIQLREKTGCKVDIIGLCKNLDDQFIALSKEIEAADSPTQELLDKIYKIASPQNQEVLFAHLLAKNFIIYEICKDGDCLFRALLVALSPTYKNLSLKNQNQKIVQLRQKIISYMRQNRDNFSPSIPEDFDSYCNRMLLRGVWGGEQELTAITQMSEQSSYPFSIYILDLRFQPKVKDGEFITPDLLIRGSSKNRIYFYRLDENHYHLLYKKTKSNKRSLDDIMAS